MVQVNSVEQYDTSVSWFTICSVGAVFSLVFTVMGIKWWFRKRITFEHDPVVESISRPNSRSHLQDISVATTGIYRPTKDLDGFEVSERPKTLPPIKTRPTSGQPFLPVRHSFANNTEKPIPEEIIPIPAERIPHEPPSTPISAVRDDFSKPVVVDIDIPGEGGYILQTDNELPKPEVRQTLTLTNYEEVNEINEVPIPKTRKKRESSPPAPVQENMENNENVYENNEIIASSEKLNEFEAFVEQERKELETIRKFRRLESVEINEEDHLTIQKIEEIKENSSEEVKIQEETLKQEDPEQFSEKKKIPYLNLEEPLDASKVISPKPRMRKGILKKKAPPVPIIASVDEPNTEETNLNDEPVAIIRWTDDKEPNETSTDDVITDPNESIIKKGVKFDHNEPEVIEEKEMEKQSVRDIIKEIEEVTNFNENEENFEDVVTKEEYVQVIKVNESIEKDNFEENKEIIQVLKVTQFDEKENEEEKVKKIEVQEKFVQIIEVTDSAKNVKKDKTEDKQIESFKDEFIEVQNGITEADKKSENIVVEEKLQVIVTMPPEKDPLESPPLVKAEMIKSLEKEETSKEEMSLEELEKYSKNQEISSDDEEIMFYEATETTKIDKLGGEEILSMEKDEKVIMKVAESDFKETESQVKDDSTPTMQEISILNVEKTEIHTNNGNSEKIEDLENQTSTVDIEITKREVVLIEQEPKEDVQKISEDFSLSKEPIPTPRKMTKISDESLHLEINVQEKEVIQSSSDTWEPQTVVHNNQVLVMTPPPAYPPPMLPNSYLSDDSDTSVSTDEFDEQNPPKPPKRYRIYVVNNSDSETTKVKPILKKPPLTKRVSFDNAEPDVFLRSPDVPDYKDVTETENLGSPLMPNELSDMSPRIRSNAFEEFEEETVEEETVNEEKSAEIVKMGEKNEEKHENVKKSESIHEEKLKIELPKEPEITKEPTEETKTPETPTAKLLDITPPEPAYDIQSPLEDKIAYFKTLAEKLNESPVKSPEKQFEDLLTPELDSEEKLSTQKIPENVIEKPKIIEVKEKPAEKVIPVRPKSEPAIPRPTSLLLNDAKNSLKSSSERKLPKRQISEPALSPRDALMAQIRLFGENQKLKTPEKEHPKVKIDVEETLI